MTDAAVFGRKISGSCGGVEDRVERRRARRAHALRLVQADLQVAVAVRAAVEDRHDGAVDLDHRRARVAHGEGEARRDEAEHGDVAGTLHLTSGDLKGRFRRGGRPQNDGTAARRKDTLCG
ncbi:MAG: hypothetical protein M5U28_01760 [Sandaracinaceae bacterium]|nr:hypothetical protein [Sandaracinaceae bacterium]